MIHRANNRAAVGNGIVDRVGHSPADLAFGPLANAIATIGTDEFDRALMAIGREWFGAVQMVAFRLDSRANCSTIVAESSAGAARPAWTLATRYQTSFFSEDPYRKLLLARPREIEMICRAVRADQLPATAYREALFDEPQLSGKVALLSRRGADAIYLNIYRGTGQSPFEQRDLDRLSHASGIFVSLLDRHVSLIDRRRDDAQLPDALRRIEHRSGSRLSDRERSLCTHLLNGLSIRTAALKLGVSEHTAVSYRRRAFLKLGIDTQKELFALLLAHSGIGPKPD